MNTSKKILIVDDDEDIVELLADYIRGQGCEADTASDGAEMLALTEKKNYDIIILDIMMPGITGLEALQKLRETQKTPVILLSALSEVEDKIKGLDIGADDYLAKPFSPSELMARINAVLRRGGSDENENPALQEGKNLQFAGWTLNKTARHLVSPEGITVELSGTEYRLLLIFLTHPQEVLSRDYLLEEMQGRELMPYDRSLDVQVCRLRGRLNDSGRVPKLIKTVRGDGYVLTAEVTSK